jgi:hypothetical protein
LEAFMRVSGKVLAATAVFVGAVAYVSAAPGEQGPPAGQGPGGRGGGQPLENIKVLPKEWSRPQVQQLMQTFVEALGVAAPAGEGCGHCHTVDPSAPPPQPGRGPAFRFPDDGKKEKDIARKMIQMTMSLNADALSGLGDAAAKEKVSCWTCHQGNKTPAMAPPNGWGRGNFTLINPGPTLPQRGARPGGEGGAAPGGAPAPGRQ